MKKRLLALISAVLILLQVLPLSAFAAETVYFSSVNETIFELSDATMPFWSGGYLYVASTMFSTRELGLYYSDNTAKQKLTLYTGTRALVFDLTDGTVADEKLEAYYPGAIVRSGVKFLPVSMIANFFGLTYTNRKVDHGYLVRVRSGSSVLSDAALLDAGASLMATRYKDYLRSKEPAADTNAGTAAGTETPSAETPELTSQQIGLCFLADDASAAAGLLDVLDSAGAGATFYVTAGLLKSGGDLVRRMTAEGYAVGLAAEAGTEIPVPDQLRAGNEGLWKAAGEKTRLCMILNGTDADRAAAAAAGYCCLEADLDRSAYGLRSVSNANYLLSRVNARKGAVSIWLSDKATARGLQAFLSAEKTAGDRFAVRTELG